MGDYLYTLDIVGGGLPNSTSAIDGATSGRRSYRSPQAVQSCMATKGIKRIAFVGDSLQRYRMEWWWWLLYPKVNIRRFTWRHDDMHVQAGAMLVSWFFDPGLGVRLVRYLLKATHSQCTVTGCDSDAIYAGIVGLSTREKCGSAKSLMNLDGFDLIITGYGNWLSCETPATTATHDVRMAELGRLLQRFKSMHPGFPKIMWVDAYSESPKHDEYNHAYQDPLLLGLAQEIAHKHLADTPVALVNAYAISRGREETAPDRRHYGINRQKGKFRHMQYFCAVERETTELILEKVCA
eukprot:jgi/Mesvir1/8402/Mv12644-RA.1